MSYEYEDEDYGGRVLWGRFAFWGALIVLAFVLGRCTAAGGVSQTEFNQTRADLTEMASENVVLNERLEALSTGGTGVMPSPAGTPDPSPEEPDDAQAPQNADEAQADAAPADEAPATATEGAQEAEPGSQTYTVQPGDTVNSIAQQFYGDLLNADTIIEANDIDDVNQLRAGQVLEIPPDPDA